MVKKWLGTTWKEFKAKKHKLGTYEIDKISFSCFDDKRYVLDDGIHTLAYFHNNSVTSCKKVEKDCQEIKKDFHKKDWEEIKKTVIKKKRLKMIVTKKIVKRLLVSNEVNIVVM